jgi:BCD family chlorophyll transporter-like MFS transporter
MLPKNGILLRQRLQLGLIHLAVAMTLVPINSTLNRVMIKELALSATLVAVLASLPYLFSPIQVAIGSFADRHPLFGKHRTPYIIAGLLLCVLGVIISPYAAFAMAENFWGGLALGVLAFGAWGMGYNLSAVSYLSLASELSGEKGRSKTVAVMFFMMITSIILTAIALSRMVDPYTPQAMTRAFWVVGLAALGLGLLGILRLEPRREAGHYTGDAHYTWGDMLRAVLGNRQAAYFFWYLIILLAAILGQDILLEPYGAEAFGMTVRETTRITAIWGGCMLAALAAAGALEGRTDKRRVARWGGVLALAGFVLIVASGFSLSLAVFYAGIVLLGIGTGLSTVSNLSLMLDMTAEGSVGLFIGAWGMANAISRLLGSVMGGALRDTVSQAAGDLLAGYLAVFSLMSLMLLASLWMLRQINVRDFRHRAAQMNVLDRAALSE